MFKYKVKCILHNNFFTNIEEAEFSVLAESKKEVKTKLKAHIKQTYPDDIVSGYIGLKISKTKERIENERNFI